MLFLASCHAQKVAPLPPQTSPAQKRADALKNLVLSAESGDPRTRPHDDHDIICGV